MINQASQKQVNRMLVLAKLTRSLDWLYTKAKVHLTCTVYQETWPAEVCQGPVKMEAMFYEINKDIPPNQ